jgi:tetratricopeptide (TPR) repeat protein
MVAELEGRHTGIELTNVPFHSQVTDQCGPAALAAVLNDAGIPVSPEVLKSRVYIPERQGSLQLELMAATRHFGRIPYEVDPNLSALVAELEAGRPILVLQNLGATFAPIWHYAVVVGYLANEQQFVLRSGDKERLVMSAKSFTGSWKRGNFRAIVALKPGDLPASAVAERYLRSVAAIESTGDTANAIPAYRVATERWPQSSLAWLGLGNASYAQGQLVEAENAYRKVLGIKPGDAIALNNLSQVYLGLGCRDDALATINAALSGVGATDPIRSHLLLTQKEAKRSDAGFRCP